MGEREKELDAALEKAMADIMTLQQVLAPFVFFYEPAAVALAGGDPDKIGTVLLKHGHQSLSLGAFRMAREEWDEIFGPLRSADPARD